MKITSGSKRYPPVGRCIYCGNSGGPLTDEHIVPLGLGGNLVLPKASCKACQDITRDIEGVCLGKMLGPFRVRVDTPSRRRKKRPKELTTSVLYLDRSIRHEKAAVGDAPISLTLPIFEPPDILRNLPPVTGFRGLKGWSFVSGWDFKDQWHRRGSQGLLAGQFQPALFCRMLAKIGHAFAVADQGLESFIPLLPKVIRGDGDAISYLVGGDSDIPAPELGEPGARPLINLHLHVYTNNGRQFLVVSIRLFPTLETPKYHTVVGEWIGRPC